MWCLIVSIPALCPLSYLELTWFALSVICITNPLCDLQHCLENESDSEIDNPFYEPVNSEIFARILFSRIALKDICDVKICGYDII